MLFLFVLSSALVQWASYGLAINGYSNLGLINFYIPVDFILLFFLFKQFLSGSPFVLFLKASTFLFLGVYLADFNLESLMQHSVVFYRCIFIVLSIIVFITQLKTSADQNEERRGFLYFNSAILIYFLGTIILFISFDKLNSSNMAIWVLHNIFEILFKLILTYSIWQLPKISR